jgi:hypothetical protein
MKIKTPYRITYRILIGIAIIFALLAGLSAIAWLLPNTFLSLFDFLSESGNKDIILMERRLLNTPIPYMIGFMLFAVFLRWLANKF